MFGTTFWKTLGIGMGIMVGLGVLLIASPAICKGLQAADELINGEKGLLQKINILEK